MICWLVVLEYSVGIFILTLLLQVIVWHCRKVIKEIAILFAIMCISPAAFLFTIYWRDLATNQEIFFIAVLVYSLCAAYIQTYPALREDIPSIRILNIIGAEPGVNTEAVISSALLSSTLKSDKEDELLSDRLVIVKNGNVSLSKFGIALVYIFKFYRNIMKINESTG